MKSIVAVLAICFVACASAGLFGGWKKADPKSEMVTQLAGSVVTHRNSQTNSPYYRKLVEIESARSQVVNGVKYEVVVVLGETYCVKQDAGANLCEVPVTALKEKCIYTFWKKPADNEATVLSSSCTEL